METENDVIIQEEFEKTQSNKLSKTDLLFIRLEEINNKIDILIKKPQQTYFQPAQQTSFVQQTAPKQQYPAVCSICGQQCTVPFKAKPGSFVKCPSCYKASRGY